MSFYPTTLPPSAIISNVYAGLRGGRVSPRPCLLPYHPPFSRWQGVAGGGGRVGSSLHCPESLILLAPSLAWVAGWQGVVGFLHFGRSIRGCWTLLFGFPLPVGMRKPPRVMTRAAGGSEIGAGESARGGDSPLVVPFDTGLAYPVWPGFGQLGEQHATGRGVIQQLPGLGVVTAGAQFLLEFRA